MQRILVLLRSRTGHDFSAYKASTIRRRIERRMNVHQIKEPSAYVRYLQENPHEIDVLFGELLISVTSFFRDPQAFEAPVREGPAELLPGNAARDARRCACGCRAAPRAKRPIAGDPVLRGTGTGSITSRAGLRHRSRRPRHRDGPRRAVIPRHRRGRVQAAAGALLHHENNGLSRPQGDSRDRGIFALHNVIKDPPFTKLDMIACRNLLIYLNIDAQQKLLPVFHYAPAARRPAVSGAFGDDRRLRRAVRDGGREVEDLPPQGDAGDAAANSVGSRLRDTRESAPGQRGRRPRTGGCRPPSQQPRR